jgi:uncharacterized protein (TIGR02118 family)
MLKIVALAEKRDDMTWEEFVDYWEHEHEEPIAELPNLKRYTIAPAIDPENAAWDGVANLYFESTDDIDDAFTEERLEAIRADEEKFVKTVETFVVSEQVQIDNT